MLVYYNVSEKNVTRHIDVFTAAVVDDVVCLTLSQTNWLRVVIRRLTVTVRTWQFYHLLAHVTCESHLTL